MSFFVKEDSIVRKVWGKGDTILFIFAGASAEFALNKTVDWLYFTGRLPKDPLGRLFSTVSYARGIVFSEYETAIHTIEKINTIHKAVEKSRGAEIPAWAYRDVLFMLIDYSIRAYELLERTLTQEEKEETFDVFYRVGVHMGIEGLPKNYTDWLRMRNEHLNANLYRSELTVDLYKQYRKHLGPLRYLILKQAQVLVVPERVNNLLSLGDIPFLAPAISFYKLFRMLNIEKYLKDAILPSEYKNEIKELDLSR